VFTIVPEKNPINELTEVRLSPVHGLGIFSRVDIPAHTIWWRAGDSDVILIRREQYETLERSHQSPVSRVFLDALQTYCYYSGAHDALVLIVDNGRYVNHSSEPNSRAFPHPTLIASETIRDIQAGEEICENYLTFDQCPWAQLYKDIVFEKPAANLLRV